MISVYVNVSGSVIGFSLHIMLFLFRRGDGAVPNANSRLCSCSGGFKILKLGGG